MSDASSIPSAHAAAPRSFAPREHGAYGQLGVPLATALAMGRPGAASLAIGAAAVLAFAAHEPLLVLLGRRGPRARREDGARATWRLAAALFGAALLGGAGLLRADAAARLGAILPLSLAVPLAALIACDREKTALGEIAAAAALSAAALPVALAAGVAPELAWSAWAAWSVSFSAATLAVRSVISHRRAPSPVGWRILPVTLALGAGLLPIAAGILPPLLFFAAAPTLALSVAIALVPPSPRSLRRVGWALVAASVASAVVLIVAAHR